MGRILLGLSAFLTIFLNTGCINILAHSPIILSTDEMSVLKGGWNPNEYCRSEIWDYYDGCRRDSTCRYYSPNRYYQVGPNPYYMCYYNPNVRIACRLDPSFQQHCADMIWFSDKWCSLGTGNYTRIKIPPGCQQRQM